MIDATFDGKPVGTVTTLRPKYARDFPRALSAHDIGLRDLVEAAQLTSALPDVHLITVSIGIIRPMEMVLSPMVEAALPAVALAVRAALAEQVPLLTPTMALAAVAPAEAGHA